MTRKLSYLFSTFFILSMISCSSFNYSVRELDTLLTNERAVSVSGKYTVSKPKGWFSSIDNKENIIDLWLIKDDYSSTIAINPINTNDVNRKKIIEMVKTSKRISNLNLEFTDFKVFVSPREFSSFKYLDKKGNVILVMLIEINNNFYEAILTEKSELQENNQMVFYAVCNSLE